MQRGGNQRRSQALFVLTCLHNYWWVDSSPNIPERGSDVSLGLWERERQPRGLSTKPDYPRRHNFPVLSPPVRIQTGSCPVFSLVQQLLPKIDPAIGRILKRPGNVSSIIMIIIIILLSSSESSWYPHPWLITPNGWR